VGLTKLNNLSSLKQSDNVDFIRVDPTDSNKRAIVGRYLSRLDIPRFHEISDSL
jgi:hypothetical protein